MYLSHLSWNEEILIGCHGSEIILDVGGRGKREAITVIPVSLQYEKGDRTSKSTLIRKKETYLP